MPTTSNPLPQLIPPRLVRARERIRELIWPSVTSLDVEMGPLNNELLPLREGMTQKFSPVKPGQTYGPGGGSWKQRWFKVKIPAAKAGEKGHRHLRWDVQGETTVYLDGVPWAGLDVGHRHCPLPDRACTLWLSCGLWVTGIWVPGSKAIDQFGPRFDGVFVAVRDEAAWNAFFDIECVIQVLNHLYRRNEYPIGTAEGWGLYKITHERVAPLTRKLLRAADDAVDVFDARGVSAFRTAMQALYEQFRNPTWAPTVSVVGMAHIDLVWLWPENVGEHKATHTFATQLRLMDRYPEYIFNQTQPAMNRALERNEPALAKQVQKKIASGQWEFTGGFEVECDNVLPSGEALARSLLHGQRKFKELRGEYSTTCWLPDVFGYSTALPQILANGGVTGFYTTKMTWSAINRFPYNSFVWKGHDGSEVMTHLCSQGYNQEIIAENLNQAVDEHRQADVHDEILVAVGYGDGGGGTTEEMCERARRFADLAGAPKVRWSSGEDFLARQQLLRERLPTYQGELYLEYHRGTYTTQSEFKRLHRRLESSLQVHEAVRVATGGKPLEAHVWQRLAFSEFHDAIPGSSIALVYQQLNPELEQHGTAELTRAAEELADSGRNPGYLVFNPLAVPRTMAVELPVDDRHQSAFAMPNGTLVPVQTQRGGNRALALVDVPALGSVRLTPTQADRANTPSGKGFVTVSATRLDNGHVHAQFSQDGQLIALIVDGTDVRLDEAAGFALYHDYPAMFDAWDIDHYSRSTAVKVATKTPLTVVESGPVRAVLRGTGMIGDSPFSVDYILVAGSRHLRIEVAIDWQERHRMLKWHLRTGYRGRWARFGTPFGSLQRTQLPGTQVEEAQWEVPGNRWAAVTDEDGSGAAIITEAKYGFSCREGDLGLTLLRSPNFPDKGDGSGASDSFTDQGRHRIRFAIGAHAATSTTDAPATALATDTLFTPMLVVGGGELKPAPFHLDQLGSLVPSWVLPAEQGDGFVLRLHETNGSTGEAVLHLANRPSSVQRVDFLERAVKTKLERIDSHTWRIAYKPYEVISIKVS